MKSISVYSLVMGLLALSTPASLTKEIPACQPVRFNFDTAGEMSYFSMDEGGISNIASGKLEMTLDEQHKATTLRLLSRIPNGRFTTSMKVAPTAGMVTAFILMGDNKDEVDMEWLGWKPDAVETTYHMKGILDEENEPLKRLPVSGGNASASYHTYAIEKTDTTVKWFVDGVEGRTTTNSDPAKFPEGVEWLMFGVWDGSSVHEWAGTAKYNGNSYTAYMDWLEVVPYCEGKAPATTSFSTISEPSTTQASASSTTTSAAVTTTTSAEVTTTTSSSVSSSTSSSAASTSESASSSSTPPASGTTDSVSSSSTSSASGTTDSVSSSSTLSASGTTDSVSSSSSSSASGTSDVVSSSSTTSSVATTTPNEVDPFVSPPPASSTTTTTTTSSTVVTTTFQTTLVTTQPEVVTTISGTPTTQPGSIITSVSDVTQVFTSNVPGNTGGVPAVTSYTSFVTTQPGAVTTISGTPTTLPGSVVTSVAVVTPTPTNTPPPPKCKPQA